MSSMAPPISAWPAGRADGVRRPGDLYEPLDLRIANCKLMTAGAIGAPEPEGRLRVATKFAQCRQRYYAEQGRQVDVIKLYGSMELAPLVGLADKIIDVVDTGNTCAPTAWSPRNRSPRSARAWWSTRPR